jgi:nucleoside-triphosphatase THEP1
VQGARSTGHGEDDTIGRGCGSIERGPGDRSTHAPVRPTLARMARALILTGDRESGKTTLCLALAASSPRFVGLVSVPLLDDGGARIGFAARNLAIGEEWVLGRSDVDLGGPRYGRFSFSSRGIARAVDCLRGILASSRGGAGASPGPVVVIDELGPLEVERGEGLAPVLPLLAAAGDLLLVARQSLVDRIEAFVPRHRHEVLVVTPEIRDALARLAIARFA